MDPSTHKWFENSGKNLLTSLGMNPEARLLPPRMGAGWISQIKDTIDLTYDVNVGPSVYLIESVCNVLALLGSFGLVKLCSKFCISCHISTLGKSALW